MCAIFSNYVIERQMSINFLKWIPETECEFPRSLLDFTLIKLISIANLRSNAQKKFDVCFKVVLGGS